MDKKRKIIFSLCLAICFWHIYSSPVQAKDSDSISIAGTGDSQILLRQLAKEFQELHSGKIIVVPDSIGSSGGVNAVIAGKADMARIARPLKRKEEINNLHYKLFAISPVVLAANLDSDCITDLSTEQLLGIYQGKINDWSQVKECGNGKIYVANREPGDSSRSVLEKFVMNFKKIADPVGATVYSTPKLVEILSRHSGTIAYVPLCAIVGAKLEVFSIDGIAPVDVDIIQGRYKLTNPFGLVWKGELGGLSLEFMEFLFSDRAREIIRQAGVVPVEP